MTKYVKKQILVTTFLDTETRRPEFRTRSDRVYINLNRYEKLSDALFKLGYIPNLLFNDLSYLFFGFSTDGP